VATSPVQRYLYVIGDSLTFHGPHRTQAPTDARLFPQVAAAQLSAQVDLHARAGWTARDAWWALTKDPVAWGVYLPRARWLVLAVGGMDALPAAVPTWLRSSVDYVRPGSVRRRMRRAVQSATPSVIRATRGHLRQLPQKATDHYLSRIVQAVRLVRPDLPIIALTPAPYASDLYPSDRPHRPAVAASKSWAATWGIEIIDLDPLVTPDFAAGLANPDGLHWGWSTHERVGQALASTCAAHRFN
jgi:diglucosylglycerate octanoyltransferase